MFMARIITETGAPSAIAVGLTFAVSAVDLITPYAILLPVTRLSKDVDWEE
jgi:hypothetical protein